MFEKNFDQRLSLWREFREKLEISATPFQDVLDFYSRAPTVSIHTDAWDETTWPDPWQLLEENQYCDFCIVLGMCYSLQLTDRFSGSSFEIHIGIDKEKTANFYFLVVDKSVLGYYNKEQLRSETMPKNIESQRVYTMPHRQ